MFKTAERRNGGKAERGKDFFIFYRLFAIFLCLNCISGYSQTAIPADIKVLLDKHFCVTCHKLDGKLIGPGYIELATKGQSIKEISALIYAPNPSNWPGYPPMAPMPQLPKEDVKRIATWIASLRE